VRDRDSCDIMENSVQCIELGCCEGSHSELPVTAVHTAPSLHRIVADPNYPGQAVFAHTPTTKGIMQLYTPSVDRQVVSVQGAGKVDGQTPKTKPRTARHSQHRLLNFGLLP